jgi:hypothetical protein
LGTFKGGKVGGSYFLSCQRNKFFLAKRQKSFSKKLLTMCALSMKAAVAEYLTSLHQLKGTVRQDYTG